MSINNLYICIYIYIWKISLFLEKRFLVHIQIKFLFLRCKYSTFVHFSRSICTKINIIFISTWFSTEASLKRLFLQLLFLKKKYFDSTKFFLLVKEWQQSKDEYSKKFYRWSYNLTTLSSRIREIKLHQSRYRKRIKSESLKMYVKALILQII